MSTLVLLSEQEYAADAPALPLWQSLEWKCYQEAMGRKVRLYGLVGSSGELLARALVVIDYTAFALSTWDVPRGPVGEGQSCAALVQEIARRARRERCMVLMFSPVHALPTTYPRSTRCEQPEATRLIDLTQSEEALLSQMKPKGRYNISVARKRGVVVRPSQDVDAFYALLQGTAQRDRFGIKSRAHYKAFINELPHSFLFLALLEGAPIAGLLGTVHEGTGYYYYGASDHAYRSAMAPYLLQYEALRHCRAHGCTAYDLLGVGAQWPGVTRFKEQFGGMLKHYPPEQEIVFRPIIRRMLALKRAIVC